MMNRSHINILTAVILLAFGSVTTFATKSLAQSSSSRSNSILEARYVPEDAITVATVWISDIKKLDWVEFLPYEMISSFGKEKLGIDPWQIERLDAIVAMPGLGGMNFGVMLTTTEPVAIETIKSTFFASSELVDKKGFTYRPLSDPPGSIVHQLSPNQILLGSQAYVSRIAKGKSSGGILDRY